MSRQCCCDLNIVALFNIAATSHRDIAYRSHLRCRGDIANATSLRRPNAISHIGRTWDVAAISVAPVRNAFSHDVKSCSRIWLKAQDLFDKYPTVLMHQIYFICNGTVEPTKPIYIYKRCNRSWIYESWNLLRVRGYNKSREKWISFLNIAWWPECDVANRSQMYRQATSKSCRSYVPRRLWYKVAFMSRCDVATRSQLHFIATFI